MGFAWTEKQFVAGTVALDFANTVCYRDDPARRFDKIADAADLAAFSEAAGRLSDARGGAGDPRDWDDGPVALALCRQIREAADALFRPIARSQEPSTHPYRALLRIHQDLLEGARLRMGGAGLEVDLGAARSFALVLTQSALRLASSAELGRLKFCPNCHWLFLDRSRNASRRWCDMLTCGNRAKAARHLGRRRGVATTELSYGG